MKPDALSHWEEVGFIPNGRRFLVWWQQPRSIYKRVGKAGTRKKPVGHRSRESSDAQKAYYARLNETIVRLSEEAIDLAIRSSWRWKRMSWAMSVELVAPIEVSNEQELAELAHLARRLVQQQTTLANEFPGAVYERATWLGDRTYMKRQADPTHPGSLIHNVQS